jgi:O-6-methylguanine DNA methyltransferase
VFTAKTFNTPCFLALDMTKNGNLMIEVYTQNSAGIWFGVALAQQQIIASSCGASQQIALGNVLGSIPYNVPFQVFHEPSLFAKTALASLRNIYFGENVNGNFSLGLAHLPAYTQKVLKATAQIPLGYVTTYGSISKAVGGGPRAVGNIMASNPFAPIVPCHRVVKSDFTLGGYGGGLKVKVELLRGEKRGFSSSKEIEVCGHQLMVFPFEYVLRNIV